MPIKIPDQLPAHEILVREGVSVMDERTALRQDIRPLQIGLLNLMPNKIRTETQIARLIGASPLQVELTLVRVGTHKAKNTSARAPDCLLPDLGGDRAPQVRRLHHHRRADRAAALRGGHLLERADAHPRLDEDQRALVLLHLLGCDGGRSGTSTRFRSTRWTRRPSASSGTATTRLPRPIWPASRTISRSRSRAGPRCAAADIAADGNLQLLMESDVTGPCLVAEKTGNRLYMFNHIEYDSTSLKDEYDPRRRCRHADRDAARLLPGQRSEPAAAQPLAHPRPPAVRQLDQSGLPDDVLRRREDR